MSFLKGLDEMLGIAEAEVPSGPAPENEVVRRPAPDPLPPDDGLDPPLREDPDAPVDPFARMIEGALSESGVDVALEVRRRYDPAAGDVTAHDWESKRESLFSGEKWQFKCRRCSKWLHVDREQTMDEALQDQGVDANCAAQMVQDIMEDKLWDIRSAFAPVRRSSVTGCCGS